MSNFSVAPLAAVLAHLRLPRRRGIWDNGVTFSTRLMPERIFNCVGADVFGILVFPPRVAPRAAGRHRPVIVARLGRDGKTDASWIILARTAPTALAAPPQQPHHGDGECDRGRLRSDLDMASVAKIPRSWHLFRCHRHSSERHFRFARFAALICADRAC